MKNKNIIPIVFAFDDNLVHPACVCISSLLSSASCNTYYDIYILHSNKFNFTKTKLAELPAIYKNCKITFREVNDEFTSAYEVRGVTSTTYYRLLIPELIPEYDKILYSDVDVIFRDDLLTFYNIDIDDYYLAGVDNASALRPDVQKYIKDKLGIDHKYGHYYAGNLVINSAKIREDNLTKRFRQLAKNNYNQQDMDIINIACYGKIKPLTPAFCLTNFLTEFIVKNKDRMLNFFTEDELTYALDKGIVHYNGPKPWKEWCVNFDVWWEAYRKSPIYDPQYYFDFFNQKQYELDTFSLTRRIKLLLRYFIYGRKG